VKTVGSHWIADVPSGWRIDTPRFAFSVRGERAKPGMEQMTASQQYGVIPQSEYVKKTGSHVVVVEKDFTILKAVYPGDFVIHMRSFQGGLELSEVKGCTSSAYVMLIPGPQIHSARYYRWVFKCDGYINELRSTSNLVRDGQAMRWANFIQVPIPFPPPEVQDSIAKYLDRETERIEELKDSIRAQIDALEAYKRSLILRTVTKGLRPNAELIDSNVDWIGDIPAHWSLRRLGTLFRVRNERVSALSFEPLSVTKNGILPQLEHVAKTDYVDNRKLVKAGDFVINSRSDRRGSCGISPRDGSVSLINTVLASRDSNEVPPYFGWLLHSEAFSDEFYRWGHGIVADLWTTNWDDMRRIVVPVPSAEEQDEICNFLENCTMDLSSTIRAKRRQLEVLESYKQSLIYEAVTGKKEVPVQ
jgi:hypothetical protein